MLKQTNKLLLKLEELSLNFLLLYARLPVFLGPAELTPPLVRSPRFTGGVTEDDSTVCWKVSREYPVDPVLNEEAPRVLMP